MRRSAWLTVVAGVPLLLASFMPAGLARAQAPVQVILDGRVLQLSPPPRIVDDRTLVPLRGVFEAMESTVTWDEKTRTVEVLRGPKYVRLKIDRHLACLDSHCSTAATMDVAARIFEDRTFVPVRFLSQAIGVRVSWDNERRAVIIETDKTPDYVFDRPQIATLVQYQPISGPTQLRVEKATGTAVRYFLIDPATGRGPMIAVGSNVGASYTYTPDPTLTGLRLLVAGVLDQSGTWRYSDPLTVQMMPNPTVKLTGLTPNAVYTEPFAFSNEVNFAVSHLLYRMTDPATGYTEQIGGTFGPGDSLTWFPWVGHNGLRHLQAVAFDRMGNEYASAPVPVQVNNSHRTSFAGIQEGAVLTRPASLRVSTNYPVESIQYLLDGQHLAWGTSHWWNYSPELNGAHKLTVLVTDTAGTVRQIGPISFSINAVPQIWFSGVGPNQVVTGATALTAGGNVPVTAFDWYLTDPKSGKSQLLGRTGRWETLQWTPAAGQEGDRSVHAVARLENGGTLTSEKVSLKVFLGKVYGPKPIVPQKEFKEFASQLAVPAYHETGMSAALQVAQAILETGWGQSIPVDKYTGQLSNNLFGIKGKGSAGSVISNTWEEYNGVAYRVDDYFRAYNSVAESWADHKELLLTRSWYAPFRAVMADPVMGAWGLRRSGYATDSQYPLKLIRIMRENDLFRLDELEI